MKSIQFCRKNKMLTKKTNQNLFLKNKNFEQKRPKLYYYLYE
jgi:hypothetical protein